MLIPKVKICGITNYEDAVAAFEMGADLLSFNFYRGSPRHIEPDGVIAITDKLPASVDLAGVFVNASVDEVRDIAERCSLDWVQLHGDEDPAFCRQLARENVKTIKALRVRDEADIARAEEFPTDAILLDAFDPRRYGGTGMSFDWNVIGHMTRRVFLAGGINPDNAAEAVGLGVYGIDVCSGIESEPGKKDHAKMRALFRNIRDFRA